jgi:hypothetical protein
MAFIARSLGYLVTMREKEVNGEIYWRAHISGDLDRIPTRVLWKQAPLRKQNKNVLRCNIPIRSMWVSCRRRSTREE